jgi:hypothetical protein
MHRAQLMVGAIASGWLKVALFILGETGAIRVESRVSDPGGQLNACPGFPEHGGPCRAGRFSVLVLLNFDFALFSRWAPARRRYGRPCCLGLFDSRQGVPCAFLCVELAVDVRRRRPMSGKQLAYFDLLPPMLVGVVLS